MRRLVPAAAAVALSFGIAVAANAAAASIAPMPPPAATKEANAAPSGTAASCAAERDMVDAERNHPGALLDMAKDNLAACEHARAALN